MQDFSFLKVANVDEALQLVAKKDTKVIAGGTDLVIELKKRVENIERIVDISDIKEFQMISTSEQYLNIGPCATFADLISNEKVNKYANALFEAANVVGSPQIRNLGTLGGNMANASVAADSIAPLMSLCALIEISSQKEKRVIPAKDFFVLQKNNFLKDDEIITNIKIPIKGNNYSTYVKIGKRKSLAIVVLGIAMNLIIDEFKICKEANIVVNAVSPLPVELSEIESYLIGQEFSEKYWMGTMPLFQEAITKLIPNRASMPYKKEVVQGAAMDAFRKIERMLTMEDE